MSPGYLACPMSTRAIVPNMATLSELLKSLSENLDSKILDFGCGDGHQLDSMRQFGFTNVTGFDVTRWSPNSPQDEGVVIDPDSIGFLERNISAFDVIFSRESVYYTPVNQQDRLWTAFYRSLKPGGRIIVIAFNGALSTSAWILQKDLAMKFAFNEITLHSFPLKAGFTEIQVENVKPEHRSLLGTVLFWFVLGWGQLNSRLRYLLERGIDAQNPRLFSKQLVMTARKP